MKVVCPECGEIKTCIDVTRGALRLVGGDLIDDIEIVPVCPVCWSDVEVFNEESVEEIDIPF